MAEPFKNLLNTDRVKSLAIDFQRAWRPFPASSFVRAATKGLDALELMDRARHIAEALDAALPPRPTEAMEIVIAALGAPLATTEGVSNEMFRLLPVSTWLKTKGPLDVPTALRANHELTQRFTAEFSIRSLLVHAQAETLTTLMTWTRSSSHHVRRLVSEGTRPRLPWAERLPALQRDPSLVLPLLEALKNDESEYVRRSVANHLNDIAKDHPALVLDLAQRWLKQATPERRKLVEHALRTLVKAGDPKALELLGASGTKLVVAGQVTPAKLKVGAAITVEASVTNQGREPTHVVVEAVVHFKRPSGTSAKKFRLARFDLPAGATEQVSRRFTMAHRSIRRLYAGGHRVEVQANGKLAPAGTFTLSL